MDQFSYAEVTVTKTQLKVELKEHRRRRTRSLDTADSPTNPGADPCGPYVIPELNLQVRRTPSTRLRQAAVLLRADNRSRPRD